MSRFNKNDIVGKKINKLLVLKYSHFTRNSKDNKPRHLYLCKCDCGTEKLFGRSGLMRGVPNGCGCSNWLRWGNKKQGETHFNSLFKSYIKNAKKRNVSFELSEEEFRHIVKQDCAYCGVEPKQKNITTRCKGFYLYNGIDRKDPKLGYTIDNSVPCCKKCNFAKYTYTSNEFKKQIKKIYNYWASK